jgi:hypothetical protein
MTDDRLQSSDDREQKSEAFDCGFREQSAKCEEKEGEKVRRSEGRRKQV